MKICKTCPNLDGVCGADPGEKENFCLVKGDYTPDDIRFCPVVKHHFVKMGLHYDCAFCEELDAFIESGEIHLICEIHNCPRYHRFDEWENRVAGDIS